MSSERPCRAKRLPARREGRPLRTAGQGGPTAVLLTGSQDATFPTREVFLSGRVARLHVGRLMLEAFEVAAQGAQAFLAIDEFAVR